MNTLKRIYLTKENWGKAKGPNFRWDESTKRVAKELQELIDEQDARETSRSAPTA